MFYKLKPLLLKPLLLFILVFAANYSVAEEAFDVESVYKRTCAVCHDSGVAGAPRKGSSVWASRLGKGEAVLLANTKKGIGAMPPKGLCQDCSDEQLSALIKYLTAQP